MSVQNYNELSDHYGHNLTVAIYGDQTNVAIECENCNEVLLDFDNDETPMSCSFCNVEMRDEHCPTEICSKHFICGVCGADIHNGERLENLVINNPQTTTTTKGAK